MASSPGFASTPRTVGGTISTANTNRGGTGTIGDLFQGGTSGSEVKRLTIQATGTRYLPCKQRPLYRARHGLCHCDGRRIKIKRAFLYPR